MSFTLRLKKNSTGEIRCYEWTINDAEWDDGQAHYFTEGNFGCDCNRRLMFEFWAVEKKTPPEEFDRYTCGHVAYTIIDVTLPDGSVLPVDGDCRPRNADEGILDARVIGDQ